MAYYALRNIAGFMLQILPNAALCFIPFTHCLRISPRRLCARIGIVILVALVPFVIVGSTDDAVMDISARYLIQNVIFFAALAALLVTYVRSIDAPASQKVFVFFLVMCYGSLVTATEEKIVELAGFGYEQDGHMYAPSVLAVLALMSGAFFVPMAGLMRLVRGMFGLMQGDRIWWRFLVLPCAIFLMVGVFWRVPAAVTQDPWLSNSILVLAFSAFAVFVMWWMLRMARDAAQAARKQLRLEGALDQHARARRELEAALKSERARVEELEAQRAAEREGAAAGERGAGGSGAGGIGSGASAAGEKSPGRHPVVLSTARQAVSFIADDMTYAESLNRTRYIHLADGETIQINMTLAQIAETLPPGQFVYCHRSVVVNLALVRAINLDEIVMQDGSRLPISRRRRQALMEALSAYQGR